MLLLVLPPLGEGKEESWGITPENDERLSHLIFVYFLEALTVVISID